MRADGGGILIENAEIHAGSGGITLIGRQHVVQANTDVDTVGVDLVLTTLESSGRIDIEGSIDSVASATGFGVRLQGSTITALGAQAAAADPIVSLLGSVLSSASGVGVRMLADVTTKGEPPQTVITPSRIESGPGNIRITGNGSAGELAVQTSDTQLVTRTGTIEIRDGSNGGILLETGTQVTKSADGLPATLRVISPTSIALGDGVEIRSDGGPLNVFFVGGDSGPGLGGTLTPGTDAITIGSASFDTQGGNVTWLANSTSIGCVHVGAHSGRLRASGWFGARSRRHRHNLLRELDHGQRHPGDEPDRLRHPGRQWREPVGRFRCSRTMVCYWSARRYRWEPAARTLRAINAPTPRRRASSCEVFRSQQRGWPDSAVRVSKECFFAGSRHPSCRGDRWGDHDTHCHHDRIRPAPDLRGCIPGQGQPARSRYHPNRPANERGPDPGSRGRRAESPRPAFHRPSPVAAIGDVLLGIGTAIKKIGTGGPASLEVHSVRPGYRKRRRADHRSGRTSECCSSREPARSGRRRRHHDRMAGRSSWDRAGVDEGGNAVLGPAASIRLNGAAESDPTVIDTRAAADGSSGGPVTMLAATDGIVVDRTTIRTGSGNVTLQRCARCGQQRRAAAGRGGAHRHRHRDGRRKRVHQRKLAQLECCAARRLVKRIRQRRRPHAYAHHDGRRGHRYRRGFGRGTGVQVADSDLQTQTGAMTLTGSTDNPSVANGVLLDVGTAITKLAGTAAASLQVDSTGDISVAQGVQIDVSGRPAQRCVQRSPLRGRRGDRARKRDLDRRSGSYRHRRWKHHPVRRRQSRRRRGGVHRAGHREGAKGRRSTPER